MNTYCYIDSQWRPSAVRHWVISVPAEARHSLTLTHMAHGVYTSLHLCCLLVVVFLVITMDLINFDNIPTTQYPRGTYVVLHHGKIPVQGFVLSDVKIVDGWPNPVLQASRLAEGTPTAWLEAIDSLSHSKDRPQFNMGVFQVQGQNCAAAVYGPLETAQPWQAIRFQETLESIPQEFQHLAHLF